MRLTTPFAIRHSLALLLIGSILSACGGATAPDSSGTGAPQLSTAAPPAVEHSLPTPARAAAPTAAVAAEPTAAPAAEGDTAAEAPAADVPAVIGGGTLPQSTPQAPPELNRNQQQGTPLKAGEVDDNADFSTYQEYLSSYSGPPALQADISERYILTVVNQQQQPVLDARVRLFAGQQQVFEGRTYSGGKTIFLPRAAGVSDNARDLRVQIDKGNSTAEGQLTRGQDGTLSFVLRDATALPAMPRLDVLFLLDATGSMDDEITQIQHTIASIAERIDQIDPRPELRFGLVAYRDRGDDYITRVYDFTPDLQTFQQLLASVHADGGGDTPESLNQALHDAIQNVTWAGDAVRLTFLVADAPPHLDYNQDYNYLEEARVAVAKGIKIYPIAASNSDDQAEYVFRQLAQQTLAHFIFLTYQPGQTSGTPGDTTTHDVDPGSFTVERLDDLVVQVIQRELAQANGAA